LFTGVAVVIPAITVPRPSESGIRYPVTLRLTVPGRESEIERQRNGPRGGRIAPGSDVKQERREISFPAPDRQLSPPIGDFAVNYRAGRDVSSVYIRNYERKNSNVGFQSAFNRASGLHRD